MSLMAVVLVMMYSGLRLGIRSWELGEEQSQTANEVRLVQEFIRRQLRQSMTVRRYDESEGQQVLVFSGEPDSMTVVTPMLTYLGFGGLYVMELGFVDNREGGQLRMRWYPYRPRGDEDDEVKAEDTLLLDQVSDLQWRYFGAEEPDQDPEWYETWENPLQRPELVQLSLKFRGESLPDLLVAVPN